MNLLESAMSTISTHPCYSSFSIQNNAVLVHDEKTPEKGNIFSPREHRQKKLERNNNYFVTLYDSF